MNSNGHKVAVVTGASRGIGAATAKWLAFQGWKIAICGRDGQKLSEVADHIGSHTDSKVITKTLDVSDLQGLSEFSHEISEEWGGVALLICNAAVLGPIGSITSLDPHLMKEAIATNVLGTFNSLWIFSQQLFKEHNSRAIVIAGGGLGGSSPIGGAYGYVPSKAYCSLLVELLAREFGTHKGAICSIAPGLIATDFMKAALSKTVTAIPDDLHRAAHAQQNGEESATNLEAFFRLVARFLSDEGLYMNGRLLSAKWDHAVNFSDLDELYEASMFRLRRIDNDLFWPGGKRISS